MLTLRGVFENGNIHLTDEVKLTGKKTEQKEYDWYTGYPSGRKVVSFARMMERRPERIVELAVRRMLPKTQMGRKALKKLKVFPGPEHEHHAQKPEKIELF